MSKAYSEEKLRNIFIQNKMCPTPGKQQSFEFLERGVLCWLFWLPLWCPNLQTGGPHKEAYGLQNWLVNESYGTVEFLASEILTGYG